MRILASITAVLLFFFVLTSVPAFSQQGDRTDQQDEHSRDNAGRQDNSRQNDQNARQDDGRQDQARPDARQEDNRDRGEARPQENTRSGQENRDEHATRPEDRGRQDQGQYQGRSEDRRQAEGERGHSVAGEHGQRIPEDRFRTSFGREHRFHVDRGRIMNQSRPEFAYGGYTFQLAQPWPSEWSYDDDCYVDYTDGDYYLYDVDHPGMRILVFVID